MTGDTTSYIVPNRIDIVCTANYCHRETLYVVGMCETLTARKLLVLHAHPSAKCASRFFADFRPAKRSCINLAIQLTPISTPSSSLTANTTQPSYSTCQHIVPNSHKTSQRTPCSSDAAYLVSLSVHSRPQGIKGNTSSSGHRSDSTPYSSSLKQCYSQRPSVALLSGERLLYFRFQGEWALSFRFGRRAGFVGALGISWGLGGGLRLGLRGRGGGTRCGCRLCPCPKNERKLVNFLMQRWFQTKKANFNM